MTPEQIMAMAFHDELEKISARVPKRLLKGALPRGEKAKKYVEGARALHRSGKSIAKSPGGYDIVPASHGPSHVLPRGEASWGPVHEGARGATSLADAGFAIRPPKAEKSWVAKLKENVRKAGGRVTEKVS